MTYLVRHKDIDLQRGLVAYCETVWGNVDQETLCELSTWRTEYMSMRRRFWSV